MRTWLCQPKDQLWPKRGNPLNFWFHYYIYCIGDNLSEEWRPMRTLLCQLKENLCTKGGIPYIYIYD